jgi:hypothetical protein
VGVRTERRPSWPDVTPTKYALARNRLCIVSRRHNPTRWRLVWAVAFDCPAITSGERMQVKIFKSTSTEKIEQEVNSWLALLDDEAVITKTETAVADRTAVNSTTSQTVIVVTVWYEEPEPFE